MNMKKFKVKICNEHFKRLGSGSRPRHSLIITANDIKDAWRKAFTAVEEFNSAGGIIKNNCFGCDDVKMWADWKIYDVTKA